MQRRLMQGWLLQFLDTHGITALAQGHGAVLAGFVPIEPDPNPRRAGLRIPAPEDVEAFAGIASAVDGVHGADKVVAGDGLAIVSAKIFFEPLAKSVFAEQGMLHAYDFRPFLVDGSRIEVADFLVTFGPYRMSHGAGVLGKLGNAKGADVIDALDGAGAGCLRP